MRILTHTKRSVFRGGRIMNDTREHILNVAFKLFMQKNFKEVTMKEIVDKTGMSKGAFYHYFESKEQLFLELINNAFSSTINIQYGNLSMDSLYQFYHDYIDYFIENLFPKNKREEGNNFSFNYFSLIFDALKLFPSFQGKLIESQLVELNLWKQIVHNAKNKGEIKSLMDDEQIARMFIYSSDGVGMRNILVKGSSEDTKEALSALWDEFYAELKA